MPQWHGQRVGGRSSQPFSQPIAKPQARGPEHNPWWWHPNRVGVRGGPEWFERQLAEFDQHEGRLAITWNPITEKWQIWARKPTLRTPICQGWLLLFPVEPTELDNRVFARLYAASTRAWGGGKAYFDRIVSEMERDKERRDAAASQEARDIAGDYYDHTKIQISMRGPSSGSKFASSHSE